MSLAPFFIISIHLIINFKLKLYDYICSAKVIVDFVVSTDYVLIFSKKGFFLPLTVQRDLLVLYSSAEVPVTVEAGNKK